MGHINFNKTQKANKAHPKSHQQLQIVKVIESWKINMITQIRLISLLRKQKLYLKVLLSIPTTMFSSFFLTFVTGIFQ